MAISTTPALEISEISRRFGGLRAIKSANASIAQGERVSIIGTNGAGKSTLFNVIAGLFPPHSGYIKLFGEEITHLPPSKRARKGLARTFQISKLFSSLSVIENVYIALKQTKYAGASLMLRKTKGNRWDRARELVEQVGLASKTDTIVDELSHGEQRQLELAMAMALEPKLLMLDEPAAGLSKAERESLTKMLLELDPEITLLLIEHDMEIALRVASRVIVMHDGEQVFEGTPSEIKASQLVRDIYLGGSIADD